MSSCFKEQLIAIALKRIKTAVKKGNVSFIPRDKNRDCLAALGIVISDVYDALCKLEVSDYKKGPEEDHNKTEGNIWVFSIATSFSTCPIYTKLKLKEINESDFIVILSFHT